MDLESVKEFFAISWQKIVITLISTIGLLIAPILPSTVINMTTGSRTTFSSFIQSIRGLSIMQDPLKYLPFILLFIAVFALVSYLLSCFVMYLYKTSRSENGIKKVAIILICIFVAAGLTYAAVTFMNNNSSKNTPIRPYQIQMLCQTFCSNLQREASQIEVHYSIGYPFTDKKFCNTSFVVNDQNVFGCLSAGEAPCYVAFGDGYQCGISCNDNNAPTCKN